MFKVAQQSVDLRSLDDIKTMQDGDEANPPITIRFMTNDSDTSRCRMEVAFPAGDTHKLTFLAGGMLIDYTVAPYVDPETPPEELTDERQPEPELDTRGNPIRPRGVTNAQAHMDGMRDTRADDPMTYQAPIPPEAIQRGEGMSVTPTRDPASPVPVTDRTRPRPNEGKPEDNPNSAAAGMAERPHGEPMPASTSGPAPARNSDNPAVNPANPAPAPAPAP